MVSAMRKMARIYHVAYNMDRRDAKAGNLNSALRYIKAQWSQAQLVLTQDADELVVPTFLCKLSAISVIPRWPSYKRPKMS